MELRFTYQEISGMIEKKAGRPLPLVYGGPHTVRMSYDVNVMFKTTSVGIDLTVERIVGSDIYLAFDGGSGIDFMLRQVISKAKKRPGGEMIEMLGGNRILLCLSKNSQADMFFDHVSLEDIRFDERYVIVQFTPKGA